MEAYMSPNLGEESATQPQPTGTEVGTPTQMPAGDLETSQGDGGGFSFMWIYALWGLIFFGFYWFSIRPQRKRDKETKEMQAAIKVGDNVITSGGMFGRVADIGQDCFVIEFGTNRGIRIPIRKQDVLGIRTPVLTVTQPPQE